METPCALGRSAGLKDFGLEVRGREERRKRGTKAGCAPSKHEAQTISTLHVRGGATPVRLLLTARPPARLYCDPHDPRDAAGFPATRAMPGHRAQPR